MVGEDGGGGMVTVTFMPTRNPAVSVDSNAATAAAAQRHSPG